MVAWHLDGGVGAKPGVPASWTSTRTPSSATGATSASATTPRASWPASGAGRSPTSRRCCPRDRKSPGELADWQAFLEQSLAQHLERPPPWPGVAPGSPWAVAHPPFVSPETPGLVAPRVDSTGTVSARRLPFDASVQALRFEPYSADTRPLTAHNLAGVGDLLGAIAHGAKGYSLAPDALPLEPFEREAAGQPEALVRLQRWIAGAEEELTASVEVRDPIAYLDYPLYWRYTPEDPPPSRDVPPTPSRGRPLRTAGPPPLLWLQPHRARPEHDRRRRPGGLPVAVFPSRDFLRLDDYGKLVVFTLRGAPWSPSPAGDAGGGRDAPQHPLPVAPPPGPPPPRGTAADGTGPPGGRLRPPLHDPLSDQRLPAEVAQALPGPWRTFPDAAPLRPLRALRPGEAPRAAPEAVQAQVLLTAGGPAGLPGAGAQRDLHRPRCAPRCPLFHARLRHASASRAARCAVWSCACSRRGRRPDRAGRVPGGGGRGPPQPGRGLPALRAQPPASASDGAPALPHPGALNLGAEVRAEVLYSATGSGAVGETGVCASTCPGRGPRPAPHLIPASSSAALSSTRLLRWITSSPKVWPRTSAIPWKCRPMMRAPRPRRS